MPVPTAAPEPKVALRVVVWLALVSLARTMSLASAMPLASTMVRFRQPATAFAAAVLWLALALPAQGTPATGLHYFAVENLTTRLVEQRGTAGSAGIAFSNLILGNNRRYRLWILQAATLQIASVDVTTGNNGSTLTVPDLLLAAPNPHDDDGDGLPNECEFVVGTSPTDPDSDDDGVPDGAEVIAGTNPRDGAPATTGLIAAVATNGTAIDVVAQDDVAVVANGAAGIAVFNVFNGMDPRIIARVDTPGFAQRVALSGARVAAADGQNGLAIVNISDPPMAVLERSVPAILMGGGAIQAVVAAADVAYCGSSSGAVATVDLVSGQVLRTFGVGQPVVDLQLAGNHVYVLTANNVLRILSADPGTLTPFGQLATPFVLSGRRLFVAGNRAYVVFGAGINEIDVSVATSPTLLRHTPTDNAYQQFVPNGSGLGLAIAGLNLAPSVSERDLWLFDVANTQVAPALLTQFATPGPAKAVAVFNGLGYVADDAQGLEVFNYAPPDLAGNAPSISLVGSFGSGPAEEGKRVFVRATAADDVQVRNVEFYLDGQRVATDGGFPFEHYFVVPRLTQQQAFRVRARASDTSGNATWTAEQLVAIASDATPPGVVGQVPATRGIVSGARVVAAFFDEQLAPGSVGSGALDLVEAGPDLAFGSPDDVPIHGGVVTYRADLEAVFRTFASSLPPGRYRATATTAVTDLAGNPLAAPVPWVFNTYDPGGVDSDGDGLPDALELLLGLSPTNPDTNGNGIPDGDEDADGDGLSNRYEVLLGTDPLNPDSDNNGIPDGAEDSDFDLLTNAQEAAAGTSLLLADTDGDGFGDFEEVNPGGVPSPLSNPTDPASIPLRGVVSAAVVRQDARPELFVRHVEASGSVRNDAAPEDVSRTTESKIISVRNQ
jgi:hypothetical protein